MRAKEFEAQSEVMAEESGEFGELIKLIKAQSQRMDALVQTSGWTMQHYISKELGVKSVTITGPRRLGDWWLPGLTSLGMFNGLGDASDLARLFVLSTLTTVSCQELT